MRTTEYLVYRHTPGMPHVSETPGHPVRIVRAGSRAKACAMVPTHGYAWTTAVPLSRAPRADVRYLGANG